MTPRTPTPINTCISMMNLLAQLLLVAITCSSTQAFVSSIVPKNFLCATSSVTTKLHAIGAAETEAERLLRKVKELRREVKAGEDELHTTLIARKKTLDTATDSTIAHLFPTIVVDSGALTTSDGGGDDDDGVCALCDRLRQKRLASDVLVRIVERLHEREVAARGLEHVAPSMDRDDRVTNFVRVSQPNEVELIKIRGLVDRLIEAAEVLDREFIEQKSECNGVITHSDLMHWGGGNIAGILKDKAKELGREHDEQFQKRLESFYDAAKRKHTRDEFNSDSWRDGDVWSP